jgi:hypothetical protein
VGGYWLTGFVRLLHNTIKKKYGITKRKIYGQMAVDSDSWDAKMISLGIPLAPGYLKFVPLSATNI